MVYRWVEFHKGKRRHIAERVAYSSVNGDVYKSLCGVMGYAVAAGEKTEPCTRCLKMEAKKMEEMLQGMKTRIAKGVTMSKTRLITLIIIVVVAFVAMGQTEGQGDGLLDPAYDDVTTYSSFTSYYVIRSPELDVELLMPGGRFANSYIISIYDFDSIEAVYVEGREISLAPQLDRIAVFMAGIGVGGLLVWMLLR